MSGTFSSSGEYYIANCQGPGVPRYILLSTQDPTYSKSVHVHTNNFVEKPWLNKTHKILRVAVIFKDTQRFNNMLSGFSENVLEANSLLEKKLKETALPEIEYLEIKAKEGHSK